MHSFSAAGSLDHHDLIGILRSRSFDLHGRLQLTIQKSSYMHLSPLSTSTCFYQK